MSLERDFISMRGVFPICDSMPRDRGGRGVSFDWLVEDLVGLVMMWWISLMIMRRDMSEAEVCSADFQLIDMVELRVAG